MILTLLLLAVLYAIAYDLRRSRPTMPTRPRLAVVMPVLASAVAFVTLLVGAESICFHYREDASGDRTYTEVTCAGSGRTVNPTVTAGPGDDSSGVASTSTVTPAAAAASAGLITFGLASGWAASRPEQTTSTSASASTPGI